ncbi:MAG: CsgG/HfaB family protein [Bryobacteraceae bacterium]
MARRHLALVLMLALAAPAGLAQRKKRIAVINFDYGTVHSYVGSIFGADVDIGRGIADILVEKLVEGGTYSVFERKAIDKIMAEQNFSNSDRADPSSAAKIGKLLGVDAIVMGSITQFGRDDKTKTIGGFGNVTGRWGVGGIGRKESKAVVAISARMVDVNTGEILLASTGSGESKRSGTALLGAGGGAPAAGGGNYDMSSSNFGQTILGEATHQACNQVVQQIQQKAGALPSNEAPAAKVDGLVADVNGATLILNVGTKAGVRVGDTLAIKRIIRTVKDPATGKVLREVADTVGTLKITEADDASAVGTFSGAGTPKVGDKAVTQ